MPIYEFYSPDTNRIYTFFARSLAQGRTTPRCPDQAKARMERALSRFAVTGRAEEKPPGEGGEFAAQDPRMERAMAEMEGEMASMSDDHPDPRQLGRLMRKMTEAAGQSLPGNMDEMIRRLEKGEDPEKLEEEYGEAMTDMEETFGDPAADGGATQGGRRRKAAPSRDPQLYEMSDYI